MCELDFDEWCPVWNEVERRARKRHRCAVCWTPIQPGEVYTHHFSVGDDTETASVCAICQQSRDFFAHVHHGGYTPRSYEHSLVSCFEGADKNHPDAKPWRSALAGIMMRQRHYPKRSPSRWAA